MKDRYPVETAKFAVASGIDFLPAYHWRVPFTLTKRDQIISKVVHRIEKKNFKYGHRVPGSVEEAYNIDKEMKSTR